MKNYIEEATINCPILKCQLETLRDKYKLNDFVIGFLWGAFRGFNGVESGYKDGQYLIKFEKFVKINK